MNQEELCEFYPTPEEIKADGPICGCNSDVSGAAPCTKEFGEECQWAQQERERRKR